MKIWCHEAFVLIVTTNAGEVEWYLLGYSNLGGVLPESGVSVIKRYFDISGGIYFFSPFENSKGSSAPREYRLLSGKIWKTRYLLAAGEAIPS